MNGNAKECHSLEQSSYDKLRKKLRNAKKISENNLRKSYEDLRNSYVVD